MSELKTIRDIAGLSNTASSISQSALVMVDAQNTYTEGIMKLDGMDAALQECSILLDRFRNASRPVFHIQHDAGEGSPYDLNNHSGQIISLVAPIDGEAVITKHYPSAFVKTELHQLVEKAQVKDLILVGFMSHMCVNSTARAAFSLGFNPTVVAAATATRALPSVVTGNTIPSSQVQEAALAALSDLPSAVVPSAAHVPN